MGKIPEEVYRAAKDDLEALWKRATEYGDFPTAREIIESEMLNFYYKTIDFEKVCFAWHDLIKAKFTPEEKKELIRLLDGHKVKVRTAGTVGAFSECPPLLRFVLAEYRFRSKMIEKGLCDQGRYGRHIPLAAIKVGLDAGWKPSSAAVKSLFFSAVSAWDVKAASFLLEKFDIPISEPLGPNPYFGKAFVPIDGFPLMWASCTYGHVYSLYHDRRTFSPMGKFLLEHGADVDQTTEEGGLTALMSAANFSIFNFLVKHGADLHAVTRKLKKNMLMRMSGNDYYTPGHENEGVRIVRALVQKYRFDVHARDSSGKTALFYALNAGNFRIAVYLLKKHAADDIEDMEKFLDSVEMPGGYGSPQTKPFLRCLLTNGVKNGRDGKNVLFFCPTTDEIECCLELGADAAAVGKDGSSPLANPELDSNGWDLLIEHGADPEKLPGGAEGLLWRMLPIMLENKQYSLAHPPIFEHIRDYQLDPDKKRNGKTLLHYAAIATKSGKYYIGLVRDLLEMGADPFIRDDDGHPALDYADADSEIRKMIREAMRARPKG
ncbi:MAG: ankyrin repeat domain-containing protein [Lentisphaeria bacterium]|nr:ankyrin repeat domain-containing protein [Lentisphaeria bacterium]